MRSRLASLSTKKDRAGKRKRVRWRTDPKLPAPEERAKVPGDMLRVAVGQVRNLELDLGHVVVRALEVDNLDRDDARGRDVRAVFACMSNERALVRSTLEGLNERHRGRTPCTRCLRVRPEISPCATPSILSPYRTSTRKTHQSCRCPACPRACSLCRSKHSAPLSGPESRERDAPFEGSPCSLASSDVGKR